VKAMAAENIIYHSLDELPAVFSVKVLQNIMGLSRALTYDLVKQEGFPKIRVNKRILVPKDAFIQWLDRQTAPKAS
jgi:predicted DNA-binding transcriptional regulator AlpA